MTRFNPQLQAFNDLVAMKYQIYNGLFLGLPFEDLANTGVQLPLFAKACREKLTAGKSPIEIVDQFFKEMPIKPSADAKIRILFQFLQLVERQVVLFDALEDAAFPAVNQMEGPGSLTRLLANVHDQNKTTLFAETIADYKIRIVLTAHPTQFYPDSVLGILTDLSVAIDEDNLSLINDLLLQMGKTRFQNRQRPTPLEEAQSLIWYLQHIFYSTLPTIQEKLMAGLPESLQNPFLHEPKVDLGFWPGGDRDGNPYVTSETTLEVTALLKSTLLALYLADVEHLMNRLTFDGVIQPLQKIRDRLKKNFASSKELDSKNSAQSYHSAEELLSDLKPLREALVKDHQGLFINRLDQFIYKVLNFGFHFASLDLRQDSRIHSQSLNEIFSNLVATQNPFPTFTKNASHYSELSSENKISFLENCIQYSEALPELNSTTLSALTLDALQSLNAMQTIQKINGEKGLHRYIISHAESVANVLEVMVLAHFAGWKKNQFTFDIIPLFETIDDLDHAENIMKKLYSLSSYTNHLAKRKNKQTIMLGFSDGTKDGGYLTANWAIHKAKRDLTRVSRDAGINAIFFDGRGGPPARGGGNTHKFYRSMGSDIEHQEIQLTIQGQTISSNFGTPDAARYNVEQLFTAALENKLFPTDAPDLAAEDIKILDRLSKLSHDAYLKFREDPLFLPYLEEMTPLPYYNFLNIASRPTRRGSSSLRFEDLRAIPFVGAWSQMKQNIPGFYGTGSALNKLMSTGGKKRLIELYRSSLFFRTLLENAMMSLSKSYFPLTRFLEKDRKYGKFWKRIYKEATDSKILLKEVTGQSKLLENNLAGRESIHLREKIILPLLVIQQYAMAYVNKAKKNSESAGIKTSEKLILEAYSKMVVKSMAANINAARNSA